MFSALRSKYFERWLPGWCRAVSRRMLSPVTPGRKHLLFTVCDHFEPLVEGASDELGLSRVRAWTDGFPALASRFRDDYGRHPQHNLFFPGEEYRDSFFELIDDYVRRGFGEVELHLHHDGATSEQARRDFLEHVERMARRGHFSRAPDGRPRYAFIHGNWALANGRPDGRYCGVDDELQVLWETGCYADFTFPSVPDVTQPNIVNQIYWPVGDLRRARAYEQGRRARVGESYDDRILIVQGPLGFGLRENGRPRLEYGALYAGDPPTAGRVRNWVNQAIQIEGRPEWTFVKLHTHGAPEEECASLVGAGGQALYSELLRQFNDGHEWVLHFVTPREMFNIAKAAMLGKSGDPHDYRDFELTPPPIRQGASA